MEHVIDRDDHPSNPETLCPVCGVSSTIIYANFDKARKDGGTFLGYSLDPCGCFLGRNFSYTESGQGKNRRGHWL